jgi:lipopolysaccharide export system protein LptA
VICVCGIGTGFAQDAPEDDVTQRAAAALDALRDRGALEQTRAAADDTTGAVKNSVDDAAAKTAQAAEAAASTPSETVDAAVDTATAIADTASAAGEDNGTELESPPAADSDLPSIDSDTASSLLNAAEELGVDDISYENPDAALDAARSLATDPGAAIGQARSLIGDSSGALAAAQEAVSSIQIQSTDTSFDETTGVARASGDVEVNYGSTTIFADTAEYHQSTGDVFARGNVTIYKDGGVFSGDEIIYNIETGEMTATELRSSLAPIFYETGQVEVPSDTEQMLELRQSLFTTHDRKDPNYKIKAKTVRIYPGEKVVFKSATVYAGGVPVLWLPYLSQPLDDELGYFFTPGYNTGWGGFLLNQYGFMIGDHTLAQLHLDVRSARGVAGGIELKSERHRNNENFGRLNIYYAQDSEPNQSYGGTERGTDLSQERYRVNLQHRVYLPGPEKSTLYLDIDVNKLSDAFFYSDFFPLEFALDPRPDNIVNLVKRHPRGTISLLGRFQLNDFFQTDTRLPELAFDFTRQPIFDTGLFYNGYTTAGLLDEDLSSSDRAFNTGRRREEERLLRMIDLGKLEVDKNGDLVTVVPETKDKKKKDGEEEEKPLLIREDYDEEEARSLLSDLDRLLDDRGFTRFDTYHEVLYPASFGDKLNVVPRVGVGYTNYSSIDSQYSNSFDRTTFHAGVDTSVKFSKVYPNVYNKALGLNELRHIIQPYANYSYTSTDEIDGRFTPIDRLTPSTRLRPIDLPLYTAVDDIRNWNIVRPGVYNRFQTKRNGATYNWLEINSYFDTYLDDPEFDRDFSNLFNEISWYPLPWLAATVDSQVPWINSERDFTEVNSYLTFMPTSNFQFSVGSYFLDNHPFFPDSNLVTLSTYTRLSDNWGVSSLHRYELDDSTLEIQQYQVHRDLSSWTLAFGGVIRDNRQADTDWGVVLSLTLKAFPKLALPIDIQPASFGGGN